MLDIATTFPSAKPSGDGHMAKCPAHEDRTASLSIGEWDDGRVLLTCHAGCSLEAILAAAHLEARDLFPQNGNGRSARQIVATYNYGTFEVIRFDPKDFRQRRPDGSGGYIWSVKGIAPTVYHRDDLKGHKTVFVSEGERDVDRLWDLSLPATCNAGGAGKWKTAHTQQLAQAGVKNVIVIPDDDMPGHKHGDQVARSCVAAGLQVKVIALPDAKDVSDYLDAGGTKETLNALISTTKRYVPAGAEAAASDVAEIPVVQSLSSVTRERVAWIWDRRIASRKLNIVAGEPGEGKSTLTLDIAARITTGTAWPDGGRAPQGSVLLLSAEDGLCDTIAPRLVAAGADSDRVHALTAVRSVDGKDRHLDLSRDLPQLEAAITQVVPRLVVIDPLSAYLGKIDSWKDSEVRALLSPLAAMADRHNCAIVGVMHLSKSSGRKVLHRLLGSIGFSAAARVVLAVAADPEDDTRRLLLPVKNNLTPKADTLAFGITDGRVDWESAPVEGMTADSVLNELPAEQGERQDADTFLREILSSGEPMPSRTVLREGRANGISDRTLKRSKARLGVRTKLVGFGAQGKWHWWLPLSEGTHPKLAHTEGATHQEATAPEGAKFPESAMQKVAPSVKTLIKHTESAEDANCAVRARANDADLGRF